MKYFRSRDKERRWAGRKQESCMRKRERVREKESKEESKTDASGVKAIKLLANNMIHLFQCEIDSFI